MKKRVSLNIKKSYKFFGYFFYRDIFREYNPKFFRVKVLFSKSVIFPVFIFLGLFSKSVIFLRLYSRTLKTSKRLEFRFLIFNSTNSAIRENKIAVRKSRKEFLIFRSLNCDPKSYRNQHKAKH